MSQAPAGATHKSRRSGTFYRVKDDMVHYWNSCGWITFPCASTDVALHWDEVDAPRFAVGQQVRKVTGEYRIRGEVRAVFEKADGAVRLVVEHQAEGGGSFLHIYSEANLELEP